MRTKKIIKRGEIYLVNWNPARGSEQSGIRPSLIIQNDTGNVHGSTTIVATISKSIGDGYPFQVLIKAKDTGLEFDSVIDLQQIMTVDKTRLKKKIGKVMDETIAEIDKALKISLGIK